MSSGEAPDSIVLHSSWSGIVMAFAGAVIMIGVTILALIADGFGWVSGVIGALTLVLVLVVVFDLPISSKFDGERVVRHSLGRHQSLSWDDITRVRRMRVGVLRSRKDARGGGLIAVVGRRNYTLVDIMESPQEYDTLIRILGERADAIGLNHELRPPEGRSPTWIYRRDKWRPDYARSR
jgi:hypothetical protein